MNATWETLEASGFDMEDRPAGNMHDLPDDVTGLSEKDLMGLFGTFTQWTCYAAHELTVARHSLREAAYQVTYRTAVAQARSTDKTVAAKKATAQIDPDVLDAQRTHDQEQGMVDALEMVHENARMRTQFLSRELSRRIASRDTDQRASKWGT
jgi:hypothetical protein